MSKHGRFMLPLIAAAALTSACTLEHEPEFQSISDEGWALTDSLTFAPSPDSTAWTKLHVRTTERYPFTQLALELTSDSLCDTLCIDIATGARMQPTLSTTLLPYPASAPLTLRHIMATDTLQGVHEIGVE